MSIRRIGCVTAGGDAPGLNPAIRAIVKTAILQYGWQVIGFEDGYEGLLTGRWRTLTLDDVRGQLVRGGTLLGTSNRANPFAFAFPTDEQPRDYSDRLVSLVEALSLDALIVVGGDGSLSIAYRLWQKGLPILGVPKTIDNDVQGTILSIGYATAVAVATDAIDRLHTTAESHHRVMIVELMGRTAGWIALAAGVAGGADVILIPEIPFSLDAIVTAIEQRRAAGRHFTIIAVAEGAQPVGGSAVAEITGPLPYQRRYGGIGLLLQAQLAQRLPLEVRSLALGHLQRGGPPVALDRLIATVMGSEAVHMLARGQLGQVVTVHGNGDDPAAIRVGTVTLADVARGPRLVPLDHPLLTSARSIGISLGEEVPA